MVEKTAVLTERLCRNTRIDFVLPIALRLYKRQSHTSYYVQPGQQSASATFGVSLFPRDNGMQSLGITDTYDVTRLYHLQ